MNTNPSTFNPFSTSIFNNQQGVAPSQSVFKNPIASTKPSAFNFQNANIQPNLNTNSFLGVNNKDSTQNNFLTTTNIGLSENKLNNEDPILKIRKIISSLSTATDPAVIKHLNFKLNYFIKGIYNNIPEIKNNFNRMYQLSRELEDVESNKVDINFFLKIYAEVTNFLKYEDKDWLTKNLFKVATATSDAIAKFISADVQCVIAQNFSYKNEVAIKFFSNKNSNCYEYYLGGFPTKESFINSVYFDVSCSYICDLWNMYNTDYKCQIKTLYNTEEFAKSKINVAITHLFGNNVSIGVDISIQEVFINSTNIPCHNLENWFAKLDSIVAGLQFIENDNLQLVNTFKPDINSLLKERNNIEIFYNILKYLLEN